MKNKMIIGLLLIALFVVVYSIILHDTDNIVNDFSDCVKNTVTSDNIKNTELYKYYNRNELYNNEIYDVNIKLRRLFVFHNFRNGVMLVKYDCEAFNNNGERIYGSSNVYAKWQIKKKNGTWEVIAVEEKP